MRKISAQISLLLSTIPVMISLTFINFLPSLFSPCQDRPPVRCEFGLMGLHRPISCLLWLPAKSCFPTSQVPSCSMHSVRIFLLKSLPFYHPQPCPSRVSTRRSHRSSSPLVGLSLPLSRSPQPVCCALLLYYGEMPLHLRETSCFCALHSSKFLLLNSLVVMLLSTVAFTSPTVASNVSSFRKIFVSG